MAVKIISYNCRGLHMGPKGKNPSNFTVDKLLGEADIVCLQETWLWQHDIPKLNNFSSDFFGTGVSTRDDSEDLFFTHPRGGVAILWRKSFGPSVTPVKFDLDWVVGLNIKSGDKNITILCIYLPYYCPDNEEEFSIKLGQLMSIVEGIDSPSVMLVGDFNANISHNLSSFGTQLINVCADNELIFSSKIMLPSDSFTYISESWNTTSWLDHVICTQEGHIGISNISILYESAFSDHVPISISINLDDLTSFNENSTSTSNHHICWDKVSLENKVLYNNFTNVLLSNIAIPESAVTCSNLNCNLDQHKSDINKFYNNIVTSLKEAGNFLTVPTNSGSNPPRPGWTEYVSQFFEQSRTAFGLWKDFGCPRQGPIFEHKKSTQAQYKRAVRFIKRNEQSIRDEKLASKLLTNDHTAWKDIKSINDPKCPLPTSINGIANKSEIADFWKNHYKNLFNCIPDSKFLFDSPIDENSDNVRIHPEDIKFSIKKLKNNKSHGNDNISSEHLKFSNEILCTLLAQCFSSFLVHGFLPDSILTVTLIPVIKNKNAKFDSADNYRPIAIASILSKVLENIILDRLLMYLDTNFNQFGFRKHHGTDMAIYTLKECLDRYQRLDSSVFICLLDASKAFDRVSHSILFTKLIRRGAPMYIVRILSLWYLTQTMVVQWGNCVSSPFHVTNGVRQGSLLSPYLFNIFVDDLSSELNSENIGCPFKDILFNHVFYADDLILISPSTKGLSKLLGVCEIFANRNHMIFNPKKSQCMSFRSKHCQNSELSNFKLNGREINFVESCTYLGHVINNKLSDDDDIFKRCRFLYFQGNKLIKNFINCSLNTKIRLFKAYFSNIYTSHLWFNFKNASYRKINVAYNCILRIFLKIPRFSDGHSYSASGMFSSHRVKNLSSLIRGAIYNFICRLSESTNHVIYYLVSGRETDVLYTSRIWSHWRKCLYTVYLE